MLFLRAGFAASCGGAVRSQSAIIPFSVEEMESGKVHMVMNSEDYLEPDSSISVVYAGAGFHEKGLEVALDIEQLLYEATTLLNAASLINRIARQS